VIEPNLKLSGLARLSQIARVIVEQHDSNQAPLAPEMAVRRREEALIILDESETRRIQHRLHATQGLKRSVR
jgi:hypothetical protein